VVAENKAPTAPLVLWLNGGPGCSSLDGFFYENGPFKFGSGDSLSIVKNPFSWHRVANMLFLESPAGVGFSYSADKNDYNNQNDTRTANDNYTFLKQFYKMYPQFAANPFWITGESYAGVYIPSLSSLVLDGILKKTFVIPFKGVMVGNGVTNAAGVTDLNSYIAFLNAHGIISDRLWAALDSACTTNPNGQECTALTNQAYDHLNDIDIYNIYGDCYHQRPASFEQLPFELKPTLTPPCSNAFFSQQYLNILDVKQAIHAKTSIYWSICSGVVNSGYNRTPNSMVPIYQTLIANNIVVLIYSGDVDFAVPFTNTQYWTSKDMGLIPRVDWRQWFDHDDEGKQVAGFVTEYPKGFTFATVKGSGHMVPQYRPRAAFAMFNRTLNGKPL